MIHALTRFSIGLFFLALVITGCQSSDSGPFFYGTWILTDYRIPGISAMSPEEAKTWVGKVAHYTKQTASFDGETCASPTYRQRIILLEKFYDEFRASPELLDYTEGPIPSVEVLCGKRSWAAPGSMLMKGEEVPMVMVWDGVFFFLQKQ